MVAKKRLLMKIKISDMDRKITLLSRAVSRSAEGQQIETFTTAATVWAHLLYKSADEKDQDNATLGVQSVEFIIRYRAGINAQDYRVQYLDDVFELHGVEEIAAEGQLTRKNYLKLNCKRLGLAELTP